jgi:hypothetical protein
MLMVVILVILGIIMGIKDELMAHNKLSKVLDVVLVLALGIYIGLLGEPFLMVYLMMYYEAYRQTRTIVYEYKYEN